jgi:hypothetical protein
VANGYRHTLSVQVAAGPLPPTAPKSAVPESAVHLHPNLGPSGMPGGQHGATLGIGRRHLGGANEGEYVLFVGARRGARSPQARWVAGARVGAGVGEAPGRGALRPPPLQRPRARGRTGARRRCPPPSRTHTQSTRVPPRPRTPRLQRCAVLLPRVRWSGEIGLGPQVGCQGRCGQSAGWRPTVPL